MTLSYLFVMYTGREHEGNLLYLRVSSPILIKCGDKVF